MLWVSSCGGNLCPYGVGPCRSLRFASRRGTTRTPPLRMARGFLRRRRMICVGGAGLIRLLELSWPQDLVSKTLGLADGQTCLSQRTFSPRALASCLLSQRTKPHGASRYLSQENLTVRLPLDSGVFLWQISGETCVRSFMEF